MSGSCAVPAPRRAAGLTGFWLATFRSRHVYVQVIVDVSCSFAFAKVYTSKMPITVCDLMHNRVLPFYENLGITVGAVLTDNGREFCGRPDSQPYELLLAVAAGHTRRGYFSLRGAAGRVRITGVPVWDPVIVTNRDQLGADTTAEGWGQFSPARLILVMAALR